MQWILNHCSPPQLLLATTLISQIKRCSNQESCLQKRFWPSPRWRCWSFRVHRPRHIFGRSPFNLASSLFIETIKLFALVPSALLSGIIDGICRCYRATRAYPCRRQDLLKSVDAFACATSLDSVVPSILQSLPSTSLPSLMVCFCRNYLCCLCLFSSVALHTCNLLSGQYIPFCTIFFDSRLPSPHGHVKSWCDFVVCFIVYLRFWLLPYPIYIIHAAFLLCFLTDDVGVLLLLRFFPRFTFVFRFGTFTFTCLVIVTGSFPLVVYWGRLSDRSLSQDDTTSCETIIFCDSDRWNCVYYSFYLI